MTCSVVLGLVLRKSSDGSRFKLWVRGYFAKHLDDRTAMHRPIVQAFPELVPEAPHMPQDVAKGFFRPVPQHPFAPNPRAPPSPSPPRTSPTLESQPQDHACKSH